MLEFTRRSTTVNAELKGTCDDAECHSKAVYLLNGHPISILIHTDTYSVKGKNIELRIPFVKPLGPTVPGETSAYTIRSKNGNDIDDISFSNYYTVKNAAGTRHYCDTFPEQEQVFIPEDSEALTCLGITLPVHHGDTGEFLRSHQTTIAAYLQNLKDSEKY